MNLSMTLFSIIFFTVPSVIIFWQLFAKALKPGWTSIVPVYRYIVMADISKKNKIVGGLGGLFEVFYYLGSFASGPVVGIGRIVGFIAALYILNAFIKQYDRGIGYWILALFFPFIGVFITKKAQYTGGVPLATLAQPGVSATPFTTPPQAASAPPVAPLPVTPVQPQQPAVTSTPPSNPTNPVN